MTEPLTEEAVPLQWINRKHSAHIVFVLALALRLFYLVEARDSPYADTLVLDAQEYDTLADDLLGGDWLLEERRAYVHGPLYVYLLAALKLGGADYAAIRIFQAVLGALSCVLILRLASRVSAFPVPLVAGLLAAGYWPFVFFHGELLATTLVLFLELVLADFLLSRARAMSWRAAAVAGVLLGLLVTTRSNALLLLPALLWWVYRSPDGESELQAVGPADGPSRPPGTGPTRPTPEAGAAGKRRALRLLGVCAGLLVSLAPFLVRNQVVQGTPLPFQGSWSLYMGTNPAADGTPYARQGLSWQRLEVLPFAEGHTTPVARGRFFRDASLRYVWEHPADYLGLLYRKFRLFWHAFEVPVSADMRYAEANSRLSRLLILSFGVLAPVALVAMLRGWRGQPERVLLRSFVGVFLATGLLFTVCARYRLPAVPFLIVFAAEGAWQLMLWTRARDYARVLPFAVGVALAAVLVHTGVDAHQVDHLRSSWLVGQTHMRNQQYELAEQAYLRAMQSDPLDSDVRNSLGAVYYRQGREEEAEKAYRKAAELSPDHALPWLNLGHLLAEKGRLPEAREALQQALDLDPRPNAQYQGHHGLGNLHLARQDFPAAHAAFSRALEFRERSGAYYGLANACAHLGLNEEQVEALEQAVALEPGFAAAYGNLAAAYLQQGEYDAAEEAARQAIAHDPESPHGYRLLGAVYAAQGRLEQSREAHQTARRLAASRPQAPPAPPRRIGR